MKRFLIIDSNRIPITSFDSMRESVEYVIDEYLNSVSFETARTYCEDYLFLFKAIKKFKNNRIKDAYSILLKQYVYDNRFFHNCNKCIIDSRDWPSKTKKPTKLNKLMREMDLESFK